MMVMGLATEEREGTFTRGVIVQAVKAKTMWAKEDNLGLKDAQGRSVHI